MNGHYSTVELLLQNGMSPDIRTRVERTPLHLAAQEGHADIVELLIKNRSDIMARDMLNMTALHWAVERGHAHVIRVLLKYGADVTAENKFELTPFNISNRRRSFETRGSPMQSSGCQSPKEERSSVFWMDESTVIPLAPKVEEVVTPSDNLAGMSTTSSPAEKEIMVVETLEGDILHVRQGHVSGPYNGISMYYSSGARMEDEELFRQVLGAIKMLPEFPTLGFSDIAVNDAVEKNDKALKIGSTLPPMTTLAATNNDLSSQLAYCANALNRFESIRIEFVARHLDNNGVFDWFLKRNISVIGYADNHTYDISFTFADLEYNLAAAYDPTAGTITIRHHLANAVTDPSAPHL